jgi:hypothetical protein
MSVIFFQTDENIKGACNFLKSWHRALHNTHPLPIWFKSHKIDPELCMFRENDCIQIIVINENTPFDRKLIHDLKFDDRLILNAFYINIFVRTEKYSRICTCAVEIVIFIKDI